MKAFILLLLILPLTTVAQNILKGRVYSSGDEGRLTGVSITNLNTRQSAVSRLDGSYEIGAAEGDKVTFFSLGYKVDTVTVEFELLKSGYDPYLIENFKTLSTVIVTGDYKADSLERRQEYENIYNRETRITGGNTPQAGAGIVLSPFSYFSKQNKETKRLKKRLKQQEEDYYINHVFPAGLVAQVTGLKGDSLALFMYQYRPSYLFARQSDRTNLLLYINDKYKEFTNPKKRSSK